MTDIEVIIQSILPSDEPQGRFHLHVSPEATIEDLLKQLCEKAGTNLSSRYCLRSRGLDVLNRSSTLAESGVLDGAFLHWTSESVETKVPCRCNVLWVLALASFLIGTTGIVAVCVIRFKSPDPTYDFSIVFDAGSTHTAMFIYKWEGSKLNRTAVATQYGSKCTAEGSGIAEFVNSPQDAGKSLQSCIDQAKATIPSSKYSNTPIYLGATAGMRLLKIVNASATEAILESIRATFSQSPFKFTDPVNSVRIISGSEEGTFGWITSNYITNAFGVNRPDVSKTIAHTIVPSIGALDLGGASTQITFIPQNASQIPAEYRLETQLFGHKYTVYTHSYLCYGVMEVTGRIYAALIQEQPNVTIIKHPCFPVGYNETLTSEDIFASPCTSAGGQGVWSDFIYNYNAVNMNYTFVGLSNGSECANLLDRTLFNRSSCPYSRCSFNGVYQPEVSGLFYAFNGFYYNADFLNLSSSNSSFFQHRDFLAAIDKICSKTWDEMQQIPVTAQEKANLMLYCLQSTYINLLLFDGYQFDNVSWTLINFVGQVSATDVGWTLGFILNESIRYPADSPEVKLETWAFALLIVLFCLFLIVSVGLVAQGKKFHRASEKNYRRMSQYGAI